MKYIKLYEGFKEDIDPFDEEDWDETEPDISFLGWLNNKYPNQNKWKKLKYLYCAYEKLENLNGIEKCSNLLYLDFSNIEELKNLNGIEKCINLTKLNCSNNYLTNLKGIENLTNLQILYCRNNNFTDKYKIYLINYCNEKNINIDL